VIYHHDDNIAKALLDLYPAIGLKDNKFSYMTSMWKKIKYNIYIYIYKIKNQ
jgi:hypothetical protein